MQWFWESWDWICYFEALSPNIITKKKVTPWREGYIFYAVFCHCLWDLLSPHVAQVLFRLKEKADGQADNSLNLEKFQCCDKPGSLFTPSPYVAWDRMGCSWQPAWGPKSGGVSVRPANWVTRPTEKIPRCVNFGRSMHAARICLKQCEGYAGLSGISRPRGPVTNV